MPTTDTELATLVQREYKEGFVTDIDADTLPPGLDEEVIRAISARKGEPAFMLEWRLAAYQRWLAMPRPEWAQVPLPAHRLPVHQLLLRAEAAGVVG